MCAAGSLAAPFRARLASSSSVCRFVLAHRFASASASVCASTSSRFSPSDFLTRLGAVALLVPLGHRGFQCRKLDRNDTRDGSIRTKPTQKPTQNIHKTYINIHKHTQNIHKTYKIFNRRCKMCIHQSRSGLASKQTTPSPAKKRKVGACVVRGVTPGVCRGPRTGPYPRANTRDTFTPLGGELVRRALCAKRLDRAAAVLSASWLPQVPCCLRIRTILFPPRELTPSCANGLASQ